MQMIPYKGIFRPAITDMLGGNIEVFADLGKCTGTDLGGRAEAFGVTSTPAIRRATRFTGHRRAGAGLRAGSLVRADGARPYAQGCCRCVDRHAAEGARQPGVKAKLNAGGFDIDSTDAAALARLIDSEIKRWSIDQSGEDRGG